jgi:hypothetical protein
MHVNNIITPEKFGFGKDRRTETAIYALSDNILKDLD